MKYLISAPLVIIGLIIISVAMLSLIDPIGTQLANDHEPFGTPPSRLQDAVTLLVGLIFFIPPYFVYKEK